jgi:exosome complex component RRP45
MYVYKLGSTKVTYRMLHAGIYDTAHQTFSTHFLTRHRYLNIHPQIEHIPPQNEYILPQKTDRPNQGKIQFNVDFSPMAGPEFDLFGGGGSNTEAQSQSSVLSENIKSILQGSHAIDEESLCIVNGQSCWSVRVDVRAFNNEGNLGDACCLASLLGLLTFKKADVGVGEETNTVDIIHGGRENDNTATDKSAMGDLQESAERDRAHNQNHPEQSVSPTIKIYSKREREPVPLSIHHLPIVTTFGFLPDRRQGKEDNAETRYLCDMSLQEEMNTRGKLILGVNQYGEICHLQNLGALISVDDLCDVFTPIATERAKFLTDICKNAVDDFDKKRMLRRTKRRKIAEARRVGWGSTADHRGNTSDSRGDKKNSGVDSQT